MTMAGLITTTATPPPFDFRRFVRAVCVFTAVLIVAVLIAGNVH